VTVGCIIQVRMGSSRLPGKVLRKLDDKNTVLDYVIDQISHCKLIDKIIIATTQEKQDDEIVEFAKNKGFLYFRGDSLDVLDRYYQCAKTFSVDVIVRATSDNPLNDPEIIDELIKIFLNGKFDYATNELVRSFPQGIFVQIMSFATLENTWNNAKLPSEREHVSPYIEKNKEKFKIYNMKYVHNLSHIRLTVDRENDLLFVQKIIEQIKKKPILMNDILKVLEKSPDLLEINKNYVLDEGYKKSLIDDKIYLESKK
jgi:spore coat polysaccharide biosynthesis protein SpsF